MKKLCLAAVLVLLTAPAAFAQPYRNQSPPGGYGPYTRPGLSPYLNLLRGGNPAANYYLGVLPERDRRAVGLEVGAQLQELSQRTDALAAPESGLGVVRELPITGHPTYSLNYFGYYNFGGAGRGGLTAPVPGAAQRRSR